MQSAHRRYANRWLRPWPVAWAVMICVAVALIFSNSLSQFASGMVHGGQQARDVVLPSFHAPAPPKAVCGDKQALSGPAAPPADAVTVPAGDDSRVNFGQPGTTYWFAPGVHVLGPGVYTQIVPGKGATFIGAPGAVLDGKHVERLRLQRVRHARDDQLPHHRRTSATSGGNQNQGVVNHESASYWTIDHTTVRDNAGAGVMLGSHNNLSYDCLADNQQYGFNAYSPDPHGITGLTIDHNEISGNDTYNWEAHQQGCGCTGGGKFWDVNGAVVTDNWVERQPQRRPVGGHQQPRFRDRRQLHLRQLLQRAHLRDQLQRARSPATPSSRTASAAARRTRGFPTSAIYMSESGGDNRVPGKYSGTLAITHNTFVNNWSGVILWENANRFCNSPANTSGGYCTLVDPGTVTPGIVQRREHRQAAVHRRLPVEDAERVR